VLDEDYRILEVTPSVQSVFGDFVGQNIWELFPGSHAIFSAYLEAAHRTGEPVEFVHFYRGTVVRIEAAPRDGRLHVSWEVLGTVDVSTLESMRASLGDIVSVLTEQEGVPQHEHSRRRLHVVKRGD
jgi:hypothetical protein